MSMQLLYRVGVLDDPYDQDPLFLDLIKAGQHAEVMSTRTLSRTYAVWDDNGDVVEIWHVGECFRK